VSKPRFIPLFLFAILLAAQVRPALAGPSTPNLAIPDGEWEGTLHAYYEYDFQGVVTGVWTWGGDIHFFSTTGELTGEANVTGTGSGESDAAYVLGSINALVNIFGSSFEPQFQAANGSLDLAVTSQGFSSELSFPLDASQTVAVPVHLTTVTCSQAAGDWDAFTQQMAAGAGGTVNNLTTLFAAVRTADLLEGATSYQEELSDLVEQANQFLADVKATHLLDPNAFQSLLTRAEELALSLRQNTDCGFTQEWSFTLPIANLVAELIDFAHANPAYFTNYDVFLLTETAVRAGVIGAGAVNPELDAEMRTKLGELLADKLSDLDSAGGNCQALTPLWIAANTVGGAAQTQAGALYTKYGC
jgi:hypothetical protein